MFLGEPPATEVTAQVIVKACRHAERPRGQAVTLSQLSGLTVAACLERLSVAPHHEAAETAPVALRSIPVRDRAVLALTCYGDHTYQQAARALDVTPELAAGLLRRALHTIGDARGRRDG